MAGTFSFSRTVRDRPLGRVRTSQWPTRRPACVLTTWTFLTGYARRWWGWVRRRVIRYAAVSPGLTPVRYLHRRHAVTDRRDAAYLTTGDGRQLVRVHP